MAYEILVPQPWIESGRGHAAEGQILTTGPPHSLKNALFIKKTS